MKVRLSTPRLTIEFEGSPDVWNSSLRGALGGAEASVEDAADATPAPAPAVTESKSALAQPAPPSLLQAVTRTRHPDDVDSAPRVARDPRPPRRQEASPAPATSVAPPAEPGALLERLAGQSGRRAERDTVLAAVWCLGGAAAVVHSDAVTEFVETRSPLSEVKVRPHLLKHVSKTKLLTTEDEHAFTLTTKGRRYAATHFA